MHPASTELVMELQQQVLLQVLLQALPYLLCCSGMLLESSVPVGSSIKRITWILPLPAAVSVVGTGSHAVAVRICQ